MKPMENNNLRSMNHFPVISLELARSSEPTSESSGSSRLTPDRPRPARREYHPPRVVRRAGDSPDPSAPDPDGSGG